MNQKTFEQKNISAKSTFTTVEQFLSDTTSGTEEAVAHYRRTAFQRFPLLFGILVILGSTATVFGVEHMLESAPFLRDNPFGVFLVGLALLGFTGRLYKRLS